MGEEDFKEIRPVCRERFQELERDMVGVPGDEYGIRRKVGVLWEERVKRKEAEALQRVADVDKKIAWDKVFNTGLAVLQSGLLVYLISGGKVS